MAWLSFVLVSLTILVGPWVFGTWEAWHFWPAATLIFVSAFAFAIRLLLKAYRAEIFGRSNWRPSGGPGKSVQAGFLFYTVFLAYAFLRAMRSEVHTDAERSFLLFLTPALVGAQVAFSFSARQNRTLFLMMAANLVLLGLYGVLNHVLFKNAYTMWLPGEPQYQTGFYRATGSYVCPDHFSGIMEFALAIGLAFAVTQRSPAGLRAGGLATAALALAGIFFSKSRGGGLTVMVMLPACLVFCLFTWGRRARLYLRLATALAGPALLAALLLTGNSYMERFSSYFGFTKDSERPTLTEVRQRLSSTARGTMFSAAYRAWKTSPAFGIGAGMHQNLWPHFAASPDGNRKTMDWPKRINNQWHSYEVHNDWLQLLEEYGLVGLILFMPPLFCLAMALALLRKQQRGENSPWMNSVLISSAIMALIAMTFHSLGDFNLQMPATTWMLSALLCFPLHEAVWSSKSRTNTDRTDGTDTYTPS